MRERIPDRFFARDVAIGFEPNTSMTIGPIAPHRLLACVRSVEPAAQPQNKVVRRRKANPKESPRRVAAHFQPSAPANRELRSDARLKVDWVRCGRLIQP